MHSSVPNVYYTGPGKSATTSGIISGLRVYCSDGIIFYEHDLPAASDYLPTRTIDQSELANQGPYGSIQDPVAAITSFQLRLALITYVIISVEWVLRITICSQLPTLVWYYVWKKIVHHHNWQSS